MSDSVSRFLNNKIQYQELIGQLRRYQTVVERERKFDAGLIPDEYLSLVAAYIKRETRTVRWEHRCHVHRGEAYIMKAQEHGLGRLHRWIDIRAWADERKAKK
jgi:hypothetical protein